MGAEKTITPRERILTAAARLLADGGIQAVSTRAVTAAAEVQAPTLYRLFGDKQGLLDAVADHGFQQYLAAKTTQPSTGDPITDLRRGWDTHVDFGLTHPAIYTLMYGNPRPDHRPPAAEQAYRILLGLLERAAHAGSLRLPPPAAAQLIQATNTGVTLTLIATPPDQRDPDLSPRTRNIILTAITTEPPATGNHSAPLPARALALDAALGREPHPLTPNETALLHDWLHRLATPTPSPHV